MENKNSYEKKEIICQTIDKIATLENILYIMGLIAGVISGLLVFAKLPYYYSLINSLLIEIITAGSAFVATMIPAIIYRHKKVKELGFNNYKELSYKLKELENNTKNNIISLGDYVNRKRDVNYVSNKSIEREVSYELEEKEPEKAKIKVKKLFK